MESKSAGSAAVDGEDNLAGLGVIAIGPRTGGPGSHVKDFGPSLWAVGSHGANCRGGHTVVDRTVASGSISGSRR